MMDPSIRAKIGELLEQALDRPHGERSAFLDGACGGDARLRADIESLMQAHDASVEYFDRLARGVVGPALAAIADVPEDEPTPGERVSHYRLLEKIGSGGMGVVYAALDVALNRRVALKFLPGRLGSEPAARDRFLTEAHAVARLDHPNVGVIHEVGETPDGRFFMAMAHYTGGTLDGRIRRGPLPASEAVAIAAQIARALAAAHRKGIVHRDVKPSNILITDEGVAKLLDFGVAKVTGQELTREGTTPGTLAYMSPEQTRGGPVDPRSDLWSLGIVLHEMVTAARPFQAEDDQILIQAIRHEPWRSARSSGPALPRPLSLIVGRCLEKDPDLRYQRSEDLVADLEAVSRRDDLDSAPAAAPEPGGGWRVAGFAALASAPALLLAGSLYLAWDGRRPPEKSSLQRVAVLPLESLSPNPEDAYIASGLTGELVTHLSGYQGLRVIVHRARPGGAAQAENQAGAVPASSADARLRGRVRVEDGRVRLTVRLLDGRGEDVYWNANYESAMGEMSALPLEVARGVSAALNVRAEAQDVPGTSVPEAYALWLKGRFFLEKRDQESTLRARDAFRRALDLDPMYAQAWSGWAETLDLLAWLSVLPPRDAYRQSRAAAERALQIAPDLPDAHVSLAVVLMRHDFELERAGAHLRRAIELNPSHAGARQHYVAYLRWRQRFDEALEQARAAADLDPLSPAKQMEIGVTLYLARRYDEAFEYFQRMLAIRPDFTAAHFFTALVHLQRQEYDAALETLDRARPAAIWRDAAAVRGYLLAVTGRLEQVQDVLARFSEDGASPWYAATVHLGLGDHERAIDLLELALEERAWQIPLLTVEPIFDPLRSYPRFAALVERLGRGSAGR